MKKIEVLLADGKRKVEWPCDKKNSVSFTSRVKKVHIVLDALLSFVFSSLMFDFL
jgi:hypothetical protein